MKTSSMSVSKGFIFYKPKLSIDPKPLIQSPAHHYHTGMSKLL